MATGTPWRATATTSAIDKERPSSMIVAGMRKGSYSPEIGDAKSWRAARENVTRKRHETTPFPDAPPRRPVLETLPDAAGSFAATALPPRAGRLHGARSRI